MKRPGRLTALAGVGYSLAWTVFGMAPFPLGVALSAERGPGSGDVETGGESPEQARAVCQ